MSKDQNRPVISVDAVVIACDPNGVPHLLTYTRQWDPYLGRHALPGVMMIAGETALDAAVRGVQDKTDVDVTSAFSVPLPYRDATSRDARGQTISLPVLFLPGQMSQTAGESRWTPVDDHADLAFDHEDIITSALTVLRAGIYTDESMVRALFGSDCVSSKQIASVMTVVDPEYRTSNITRDVISSGVYMDSGRVVSTGRGRPSKVWSIR